MSKLKHEIRERGHWTVEIRPANFTRVRVGNVLHLREIVAECTVRFRGWDYPYVDQRDGPSIGVDYIEQEVDWNHNREVWRFYQSGLFMHLFALAEDWRDRSQWWPPDRDWRSQTSLSVADVIYTFSEIYEFAARVALSDAGSEQMTMHIILNGLSNRSLTFDVPDRMGFTSPHSATISNFPVGPVTFERDRLIGYTRRVAMEAALGLFQRFGWDAELDRLLQFQSELVARNSRRRRTE